VVHIASFLYDELRLSIGGAPTHSVIDLKDDTIKCVFIDEADDTISQTADQDWADRAAGSRVGTATLANKTSTLSSSVLVWDADDIAYTALSGDQVESYDMYKDSGAEATSPMIANFDDATGLPLTPSGGNVTIVLHANGIIRI
jgi:hypothetical protein